MSIHPESNPTPEPNEKVSKHKIIRSLGRGAARGLVISSVISGPVIATTYELADRSTPFEVSNLPKIISSEINHLFADKDSCIPHPDYEQLESLSARNHEALDLDNPADIAEHFGLTLVPYEIYAETFHTIENAADAWSATGVMNDFTQEHFGFGTKLYITKPEEFDQVDYRDSLLSLHNNLHVLPKELFDAADIDNIFISDNVVSHGPTNEGNFIVQGRYNELTREMILNKNYADSGPVLIHELMHGLHQTSCDGSSSIDSALGDFNPPGHSYVGDQYLSLEPNPALYVDNYSALNIKEDFAKTGETILTDSEPQPIYYLRKTDPVNDKKMMVLHRLDEITKPGMAAYLDTINAAGY